MLDVPISSSSDDCHPCMYAGDGKPRGTRICSHNNTVKIVCNLTVCMDAAKMWQATYRINFVKTENITEGNFWLRYFSER